MLVWDKSLWINLAGVLPGRQEILHRSGVSDPRVQRWIYEGIYFGFPLGQHQLPKTQWKPAPNKSLSSTWRDRLCLQQLHLKNKRCHSRLHQICQDSELVCFYMGYTTAHLPCDLLRLSNKGGRGKQQHQLPQLQHGKSSRGGCWRMARRAGVHPLNLPRDSRCCNLLQAEKSSKPQLSLQCGQARREQSLRGAMLHCSAFRAAMAFAVCAPACVASGLAGGCNLLLHAISTVIFTWSACCFLSWTAASLRYKGQKTLLAKPGSQQ